jgi:hypothetical protein
MDAISQETQLEAARKAALEQIKVIKEKTVSDGGAAGGEVLIIETDIAGAELLGFRIPKLEEWKQFQMLIRGDAATRIAAISNLVTLCCIFPVRENFVRIIDAHPGIVDTCYPDLQAHAGAGRAKKAYTL